MMNQRNDDHRVRMSRKQRLLICGSVLLAIVLATSLPAWAAYYISCSPSPVTAGSSVTCIIETDDAFTNVSLSYTVNSIQGSYFTPQPTTASTGSGSTTTITMTANAVVTQTVVRIRTTLILGWWVITREAFVTINPASVPTTTTTTSTTTTTATTTTTLPVQQLNITGSPSQFVSSTPSTTFSVTCTNGSASEAANLSVALVNDSTGLPVVGYTVNNQSSDFSSLECNGSETATFIITPPVISVVTNYRIVVSDISGVGASPAAVVVTGSPSGGPGSTTTTLPGATTTTTVSATTTTVSASTTTTTLPSVTIDGLTSQAFPTAIFIASYDWLTNFYDYNSEGRDTVDSAGHNTDPDTDNFNKIILADSNLFPMITATLNDIEFPNITSRNTDDINDYVNRSVAVAPNYISTPVDLPFKSNTQSGTIQAVGLRSHLGWVFVTDPANHNLRRYQFEPHEGWYFKIEEGGEDFGPDVVDADIACDPPPSGDPGVNQLDCDNRSNCCTGTPEKIAACGGDQDPFHNIFTGDVSDVYEHSNETALLQDYLDAGIERVFLICREQNYNPDSPSDLASYANQVTYPILEYTITVPDNALPITSLPITIMGSASDSNGDTVFVGVNGKFHDATTRDPGPSTAASAWIQSTWPSHAVLSDMSVTFTPNPAIDATWDLDSDSTNGIQLRISVSGGKHGGLAIGYVEINEEDRQDRGFGVALPGDQLHYDYTEAQREARWNDIDTFLETVPPESYPGYNTFTSGFGEKVGYGYTTNTSFDTAENIRFKNPRDVDVFRDYFDEDNGGPVYIFVADTMNSRVQVFMNATGSAGQTGAAFPVRPVRVKGPNDTGSLAYAAYSSNEIAVRPGNNAYGDGRKSDWRAFLPNYSSGGAAFQNVSTGKGEFFYPHGIAVDQDPDTEDVYLFVADTYNHRIQVFRHATSLANQPITDKQFNFEFEAGWGAYPLNSTQPGPYAYKYPKGIDVARFANNSSYLYVVDSKNHRLMKYLITENGTGGFQSISAVAGYGYDGSGFSKTLTTDRGRPITSDTSLTPGFVNPQDVVAGYSGFFEYTTVGSSGVKFLNNYMVYVTDYARNDNTDHSTAANWQNRLNMRVMQFIDGFPNTTALDGVYLPWATESVTFGSWTSNNLELGQSILGTNNGRYNSKGVGDAGTSYDHAARPGPPENSGVNNVFTDRPVGIATLSWNTTEPIDMRVVSTDLLDNTVYANGATIPLNTNLTVGVSSGVFFWFQESDETSYTNSSDIDGRRIGRVHVFWYNNDGSYNTHQALSGPPFNFNSGGTAGYIKVISEDADFGYSGRTGTQIFRIKN